MGSWWKKRWAERWVSALIVVFGGLGVISLAVLRCGGAEKYVVQLLGLEYSEMPKYEALKFLGIVMGGVLLTLQAVIANKRAKAMEKTAKAQLGANQATGRGQQQERMKNAIEHLGNASDSVRLGGAYELFHLAEDTEDRGQRQTVLDILCAHIRWTTLERQYRWISGGPEYIEYKDKYPSNPSEEIQSLLTLLFVQKYKVFIGLDINLQGSCLNGSILIQARLEKAHLEEAQLQGARLEGARLQGADLIRAQLQGAHLEGAQLHGLILLTRSCAGLILGKRSYTGLILGERNCRGLVWKERNCRGPLPLPT